MPVNFKETKIPSLGKNTGEFADQKLLKVTEIEKLTPELVHEFISKIEVHKPYRENGVRYQQIDIYYHGVGIIRLATAEEMEAAFQKHIENKQKNKQKTA